MWEGALFPLWQSSVNECGGRLCSHPTVVWALWIHDLSKEGTWDQWMDRTRRLLAPQVEVKAGTIKRLPQGDRQTGSLLDEALGSGLTPNALEDDGGRVGIRALVLQPHEAVSFPPLIPEFRQVRRALLRRTDFERFGYTNNFLGCANAREGRKQAVDHSEQYRSRMEKILLTTTEGHERLERARDRFAQVAKSENDEPERKRHRPEEGEAASCAARGKR